MNNRKDGEAHGVSDWPLALEVAVARTDGTCRMAVDGRRATRALADWARRFELSEPDFQVLWCLRFGAGERLDQATLAARLALSPSQVSLTVERLRAKGLMVATTAPDDRRRKRWQLTPSGQSLLAQMLADIGKEAA